MGTVLDKERTAQFYIMSDEADATVEDGQDEEHDERREGHTSEA